MALSYFTIPDTGTIVYEGDIVILSEYPDNFAIASHGWYEYEQTRANGWYFVLLPRRETIPAANVNVSLLTVVTSTSCAPPCPTPIPDPDEHTQSRTFITFDTIAQRDGLTPEFIPDGRIVRINDAGEGKAEYYEWSAEEEAWKPWDILTHLEDLYTALDDAVRALSESIQAKISKADGAVASNYIADVAITNNKIADAAVDTRALGDGAITSDKLAEDAVNTSHIHDQAITSNKLADASVETSHIADNAVTSDKLSDTSVTTDKIEDGSVTLSKLSTGVQDAISAGASVVSELIPRLQTNYIIALDSSSEVIMIKNSVLPEDLTAAITVYIPADWHNILQSDTLSTLADNTIFYVDGSKNGQTFTPTDYGYNISYSASISYNYNVNDVLMQTCSELLVANAILINALNGVN